MGSTVSNTCNCPSQDIVIVIQDEDGSNTQFIPIPKGSLCDEDNYMTPEQFNRFLEWYQSNPKTWKEKLENGGI